MRSLFGVLAALFVLCTWLACGSSEEGGQSKPSTGAAAARPAKPARPAAPREVTADHKQGLMDMLVWPEDGQAARDKVADGDACNATVDEDEKLQKGVHALVKVQAWIKCMEGKGWERKKTS